ncbi:MAG: ribose-phosphate diphosphokinase [Thermoprotei archaeon]|nr:MAG: ribose-phosphate diphosphokinase [Thermoprotei archaeon]
MIKVVPGPASRRLGASLAEELKTSVLEVESKVFPDGESYVRLKGEVAGEEVVVVQSCYPPQDKHLIELLLLVKTIKELGARKVIAAVPYLAYSRQDKRFLEGEAVSGRVVLELIGLAGADALLTVDVHSEALLEKLSFKAVNVSAMPLIARYLSQLRLLNPFILSPDKKRAREAGLVASLLNTDHGYLEKVRDLSTGEVKTMVKGLPVEGRDVVIVDDIISTGGTIANAASIVKSQGARRVLAACTHPILAKGAEERMRKAGVEEIIGTDAVESHVSRVSVAPALAEALRKL